MVDYTKWDTGQVIASGVLNRTAPESRVPQDAVLQDVNDEDGSEESIRKALLAGGISAPMYYGVWKIWKDGDGYSGQLMQYRNETGRFDKVPLEEAVQTALEWWGVCYG